MSGKVARRMRKRQFSKTLSKAISKKTLALCAGLCLSYAPMVADNEFLVSLFPHFSKPFGEAHDMKYGIGAGLRATYRPVKFLNIYAQGDYLSMMMPGIDPVTVLNASLGTGYHLDITDRMSVDLNLNVGAYNAKATSSISGISAGAGLVFSYKINPVISVDVGADASHYAAKSKPLMMLNATASPGITFNITEIFNKVSKVEMSNPQLAPVFPVLYSWYENNSFGQVNITNKEDSDITDVTVSFYQPQYMAHAKECTTIRKIKKDETIGVDLIAFFNEQMLELTEKANTNSYVIVNYSCLGQKRSKTFNLTVPVYGRNNMSWDDDRRAAVFVSSKDPAAMQFAKYTASIVRDNLRIDVPMNIQYALGIFEALNQFGLNYVVDPASAFEDNVGTSSIDFLQFPYQTLMYRGGDCDDISILVCSLFEAVGIETAFITVPGHIFMAFDSGITPAQAIQTFRNSSDYIVVDDQVWIPLEITLTDEGFYKACRYGSREWNNAAAQGAAALYRMRDCWEIYQPISVPGATAYFNMPGNDDIRVAFNNSIETWGRAELNNMLITQSARIALIQTEEPEKTETVIKEDPLSPTAVSGIVSLANNAVAIAPVAIREEELEDELEGELELDDDRHPELDSGSEPESEPEPAPETYAEPMPVPDPDLVTEYPLDQETDDDSHPDEARHPGDDSHPELDSGSEPEIITNSDDEPEPEPEAESESETDDEEEDESEESDSDLVTEYPLESEPADASDAENEPETLPEPGDGVSQTENLEIEAEIALAPMPDPEETGLIDSILPVGNEIEPAAVSYLHGSEVISVRPTGYGSPDESYPLDFINDDFAKTAEPESDELTDRHPELDSGSLVAESGSTDLSLSGSTRQSSPNEDDTDTPIEEDEDPFSELEALASSFLESDPEVISIKKEKALAASDNGNIIPAVYTIDDKSDADTTEEQSDSESSEAEERSRNKFGMTGKFGMTNIIIISTVTLTAALAAGIIIGKKKKREEEKS